MPRAHGNATQQSTFSLHATIPGVQKNHTRGPVKLRNVIADRLHNEQRECEQDGNERRQGVNNVIR
jgi:hypothetical protein